MFCQKTRKIIYVLPKCMELSMLNIINRFVIFKLLSYCFQETIGFNVQASFVSRPMDAIQSGDIKNHVI